MPTPNPIYEQALKELKATPRKWLVTGCAGFIGSNLLEALLKQDQTVVGLDNYATGYPHNIEKVKELVSEDQRNRFTMIEGDLSDLDACKHACEGVDHVLHQGALGSVPRSIADPINSNAANVTGFLNMLVAARDAKVKSFVYASSSSVYGDHPDLPKVEANVGNPLSPYAVTKKVNELYAEQFANHYGLPCRGLRYFNVFGPRQDPNGAYAAVIPKWIAAMIQREAVRIFGDGETSRDFCYIENVVQANLLAAVHATTLDAEADHQVFNIAVGAQTTLNALHTLLQGALQEYSGPGEAQNSTPVYEDFRPGDVRHSLANIDQVAESIGYAPTHTIEEGIAEAMPWYIRNHEVVGDQ